MADDSQIGVPVTQTQPLTLTEAKLWLKVDHTADDDLITTMIVMATNRAEAYLSRKLISGTLVEKYDSFCDARNDGCFIRIPSPPLTSVTSIQYIDEDGVTQTWSSAEYTVDTSSEPGRIALAFEQVWPTTRRVVDAVTITYLAGYATADAVPDSIKQGMYMIIASFYEDRNVSPDSMKRPRLPVWEDCWANERIHEFYRMS